MAGDAQEDREKDFGLDNRKPPYFFSSGEQLAEAYWLCIVWDPLDDSLVLVPICNPVAKLDHAKREIVAARFYEISAVTAQQAAKGGP